jgi:hypothetical protein
MRTDRFRPSPAVVVSVAALTVALGGVASATIPDSSGVIHGCYKKHHGQLRVIDTERHQTCNPAELAIQWSQTGPPGPTGSQGPTGPQGSTGAQGTLPGGRMWINPLDFLAGDQSVKTSFNAVTSGVGGGLSLIIESTTTGDEASGGGNKVVERGLDVPPGYRVTGVRVCYELSNTRSFIDQIGLAQVQEPPKTALVALDDPTHQNAAGPTCVDSKPLPGPTNVDAEAGEVLLSLRLNFGDTSDRIVLRGVALALVPK